MMIDNLLYDLMEQTVEESKSLWRIQNNYLTDATECTECRDFWEQLKTDKENHCQKLLDLITSHMSAGEKMEQQVMRR